MGWTRANRHAGRTTSRKMKDFAVTITLTTRYGRMTAMKWYPAVLSSLLLGFLPVLQLHALETDTFHVTDLTGHLPPATHHVRRIRRLW